MKKIAIYGKGGIGKSTTTSNLSAALASRGLRVMQIGCDPKADSTKNLMGGERIPTVLDQIREKEEGVTLDDIAFRGYGDVVCGVRRPDSRHRMCRKRNNHGVREVGGA